MSNWKTLAGGGGSKMMIHGDYAVAAELHRVTVWKQDELWCQQTVDLPQPGFPRLIGHLLYWGAGVLDLQEKKWQDIPGIWATLASEKLQTSIANGAGYTPNNGDDYTPDKDAAYTHSMTTHGAGYTPTVFSWAPDGSMVAVSVKWTGQPGPSPAKVLLLDREGRLLHTLWEESDLPVAALYISEKWILAGTRQLRFFDKNTFAAILIPEQLPAVKIEMTADEKRLLLLQYDHIGLWDAAAGKEIHRWNGQWSDATITPDGKHIVAVDVAGKAYLINTAAPHERSPIAAPGAIFSVAANNDRLLAFFMEGAVVRITTLL